MQKPKNWSEQEEKKFQSWYKKQATKTGLNPNPDDKRHYYDYRRAYRAGVEPDPNNHWPSKFKDPNHPRRYIGGIDTITGKKKHKK